MRTKNILSITAAALLVLAQLTEVPDVYAEETTLDLGWKHLEAGNYAEAEELANQLLNTAKAQGSLKDEFNALGLIVAARYSNNLYSKQLVDYQLRQESIALELDNEKLLASVSNNLGYDLLTTGQAPINEVIPRLERANSFYAKSEGHEGRWYTLMNLTWAYRKAGRLQDSVKAGNNALKQAKAIDDRHAIIETSLNLAETHVASGNNEKADELFALAKQAAGDDLDRDRYVYEVYAAQHSLTTKESLADPTYLIAAVEALESKEIFYEMLGRSVLAQHYQNSGNKKAAKAEAEKVLAAQHSYVPREAVERAKKIAAKY